ncbi:MAG TPA: oligosaccharide flippase family protein [Bacteroidia bacterium]|nr:oligosaccharide flippase family protein [Bacteroidia bacterium]
MSNPLKKLAGQTAIYGLGSILPRIINYLFSLALTFIFKIPADLASNTLFYACISFVNIIFTYGMETSFFYFSSKTDEKDKVYSTALISIFASTLTLSLVLCLFSQNLAELMDYPENRNYVIWCVLIVATDTLMALPFAKLRINNNAKRFAFLKVINVTVYLLVSIFYLVFSKNAYENGEDSFLAHCYDPQVGVGYAFLAQLVANIFSMLLLAKEYTGFAYVFDKELWKQLIKYAWPLLFLGLAGMINETFDRIILDYLLPADIAKTELGIYGACYKIAILMTIFITAFRYAAEPFFFNQAADKNSKKVYALVMKYFVIFCSFLFLGTMMNIDLVQMVIYKDYRSGIAVAPILLIANLFLGVYFNLSIWYKLTGQTRYGAIVTIIGAIITLAINFAFIGKYSYMACAWATLAAYGSMMVISYFLGQKHYPVKYNLRSMLFFFFAALGFYFISLTYNSLSNIVIKLILNNLFVILFAWLFYKLEFSNLKNIKNQLQS